MTWTLKPHLALSLDELYAVLTLRQRVFVVEQNCPYLDNDGHNHEARTSGTPTRRALSMPTSAFSAPA